MTRRLARPVTATAVVAVAGVLLATPAAGASSAPAASAPSSSTTWVVTGLQRGDSGLVLTARATRHGDATAPTSTWLADAVMGGCTDVHVFDPSTGRAGLALPGVGGALCPSRIQGTGPLADGASAEAGVTLADPGGTALDVVVDGQAVATAVPVTGGAAPAVSSGSPLPAGVVAVHGRQVSPRLRFTRAGAAATGRSVDLSTDVLFAFDSDVLGPDAPAALDVAVQQLQAQPSRTVTIVGHTDSVGDAPYNLALSQRRAEAVRAALAGRLGDGWTLDASGAGETQPVADETRPSGVDAATADAAVAEAQRLDRRVAVTPG